MLSPHLPRRADLECAVSKSFRRVARAGIGNLEAAIQDLTPEELTAAVEASVRHAFPDGEPTRAERDRYVQNLHIDDLALATACALGRSAAWDRFVLELRPVLYRAADALDPAGGAREVADSLYGELYGIKEVEGERRSLFRYFHGRSSLATWLRAVGDNRRVIPCDMTQEVETP